MGGWVGGLTLGLLVGDAGGGAEAARVGANRTNELGLIHSGGARLKESTEEEGEEGKIVQREGLWWVGGVGRWVGGLGWVGGWVGGRGLTETSKPISA